MALQNSIEEMIIPYPCVPLMNHYFYKKQRLNIQFPNIFLGLVFEFRPQKTRDLVIVFVVHDFNIHHLGMNHYVNFLRHSGQGMH